MENFLPNRRWLQFSLRTLLVVVTMVGAVSGWLAKEVHKADRQAKILARVTGGDSFYLYADQWSPDSDGPTQNPQDWQPNFLQRMFGENFMRSVVIVNFDGSETENLSDQDTAAFGELTELRHLSICHAPVTDESLAHFSRLTHLKELSLSGAAITDAGLKHLAGLTEVEQLLLYDTPITDEGLVHLQRMTHLKYLALKGTKVSNAGLERLACFKELKTLSLPKSCLGGPGLAKLAPLTELERLYIPPASDDDLRYLPPLPKLIFFQCWQGKFTDAGMKEFRKFPALKTLDIWGAKITDAGLLKLQGMTSLVDLKVTQSDITADGVSRLELSLPNCRIDHRLRVSENLPTTHPFVLPTNDQIGLPTIFNDF